MRLVQWSVHECQVPRPQRNMSQLCTLCSYEGGDHCLAPAPLTSFRTSKNPELPAEPLCALHPARLQQHIMAAGWETQSHVSYTSTLLSSPEDPEVLAQDPIRMEKVHRKIKAVCGVPMLRTLPTMPRIP